MHTDTQTLTLHTNTYDRAGWIMHREVHVQGDTDDDDGNDGEENGSSDETDGTSNNRNRNRNRSRGRQGGAPLKRIRLASPEDEPFVFEVLIDTPRSPRFAVGGRRLQHTVYLLKKRLEGLGSVVGIPALEQSITFSGSNVAVCSHVSVPLRPVRNAHCTIVFGDIRTFKKRASAADGSAVRVPCAELCFQGRPAYVVRTLLRLHRSDFSRHRCEQHQRDILRSATVRLTQNPHAPFAHAKKQLDDGQTLSDCNISDKTVLKVGRESGVQRMRLDVRYLGSTTASVATKTSQTVRGLKAQISIIRGIPVAQQYVFSHGSGLGDERTLGDCGLSDGDSVTVVRRLSS